MRSRNLLSTPLLHVCMVYRRGNRDPPKSQFIPSKSLRSCLCTLHQSWAAQTMTQCHQWQSCVILLGCIWDGKGFAVWIWKIDEVGLFHHLLSPKIIPICNLWARKSPATSKTVCCKCPAVHSAITSCPVHILLICHQELVLNEDTHKW